jgi:thiamine transport system ATP-binding protein
MLDLQGLHLRQGPFDLHADLRLQAGGVTAVIGPSGAGKSTLLAAIAGFLLPVAGRILWDGQDITALAPGVRPVSILFQDQNLFPHLTIGQNVGLGLVPRLRLTATEARAVAEVLASVGLDGLRGRHPGDLSGGQQARAALARVLIAQRPLVLMDEPFGALGPALRAEMLDLCRDRIGAAGGTLIMVTHAPDDAARIADQSVVVADGHVRGPFKTAALLANPPPALAAYLGAIVG